MVISDSFGSDSRSVLYLTLFIITMTKTSSTPPAVNPAIKMLHRLFRSSTELDSAEHAKCNKETVCVSKRDKLYLIAINRPEEKNCINPETAYKLKAAFEEFENDRNALVAILYGSGESFCAGYDLKEVASGSGADTPIMDDPMSFTRMTLKKPVIAAIAGSAVKKGFELALWCDLRIVEETAVMGGIEYPFDGGRERLCQIVGLGRALDLIMTGREIKGKQANEYGLATQLCKKKRAMKTAVELANILCKLPQDRMNADRLSAYKNMYYARHMEEFLPDS